MPTSERSLNLPNAITFSRFVLSLVLFALMQAGGYWLTAAGLFVFAVLTDVLDGWIARRYKLMAGFDLETLNNRPSLSAKAQRA